MISPSSISLASSKRSMTPTSHLSFTRFPLTKKVSSLDYVSPINLISLLGALIASRAPVILGVPPDPSSTSLYGRRKFANGNVDHHGPPRLAVSPAKTSVKKTKAIEVPESPEEISSSSPGPSVRVPRSGAQKKVKKEAPISRQAPKMPQRSSRGSETIEIVSDGTGKQPPLARPLSKKRVRYPDSSSDDDSPIVKRHLPERLTNEKGRSMDDVDSSDLEEDGVIEGTDDPSSRKLFISSI